MPFDWENYLIFAKRIKAVTSAQTSSLNRETLLRTAVSRAYYGIYHLATDYAISKFSYPIPNKNRHDELQTFYKKESQRTHTRFRDVSKILLRLHTQRKKCDYDADGLGNLESMLESVIIEAEELKSHLV